MEAEDHDKTPELSANFKPYAENILPLLRIYMTWICTYRTDIVKYGEHLEPYAHDMYRTLGQALTTVIKEFLEQDLATSSYLLPEDLEALGLNPLDDTSLPSECRLHYTPDQDTRKPRPGDTGCIPTTPQQELLSRIYDILSCGYFLATDRVFPFAMITVHEEARDITAITYQEEDSSQQFDESTTKALPDQSNSSVGDLLGKFGDLQASPVTRERKSRQSLTRDSLGKLAQDQETPAPHRREELRSPTEPMQSTNKVAAAEFESDFNIDRDMYNLVNDFLAPPESRTDQAVRGGDETSYGMQSSTANEVFGSLQNKSPTPGSATAKAFPTLPWDFFISPAPHGPSQEGGAMRGLEHELRQQKLPGSPEDFSQYRDTRFVEDPFTSPRGLQSPFQDPRRKIEGSDLMSTRLTSSTAEHNFPDAYARRPRSDVADIPQNQNGASERFRNRFPVPGDSNSGFSGQHPWPAADAYTHTLNPPTASNSAAFWQGPKLGAERAAFASSNFSQNASSLPPVNSPWGLEAARQTHPTRKNNIYPYGGALVDSSAHFSPSGNLYQSNGNFYNATTAFGRGPIANKDDPTHFKNAVKRTEIAAAVEAADAYDRAILAGALLDDKRPQR